KQKRQKRTQEDNETQKNRLIRACEQKARKRMAKSIKKRESRLIHERNRKHVKRNHQLLEQNQKDISLLAN
ncbi:1015_t:CDS:1, partial [Acaulospora colombiana]